MFEVANIRPVRIAHVRRLSRSNAEMLHGSGKQGEVICRDRPGVTRELDWLWRFELAFG